MKSTFLKTILALALTMFCATAPAVFDPVNDDTDLFRNNPNIPSERPNVLIVLDNTANWNTAFDNEKTAFTTVINALDSSFNVGWMMYPETGGGNDSVDGGYVRFAMRQMTSTNKTALSSIITAFDKLNDKGNNSTLSLAMYEAYLYFAGKASRASFGKVKTDFTGSTANPIAAALGNNALPASPTAASLYNTATLGVGCAKNYIIYISNGPANENSSSLSIAQGFLQTLTGSTPPATISITPNGMQSNWGDEYAKFMAGNDVNTTLAGNQFVTTYTVEIDPGSQNQDQAMTALMKSMAANGNGKYFAVTSGNSGSAIVAALNSIFSEIQAVNSVFAASTLPVSVNVRGTNLNQLYIGVFRPDAGDLPRWFGNLKAYQLKKDPSTGLVFTVDSAGNQAINSTTGFITASATSFWTSGSEVPTNYWSFRSSAVNGVGGNSDSPDGDLVEKGGAAQQVRSLYFQCGVDGTNCTPTGTVRPLYTCTQGPLFPVCAPGSLLSATPFGQTNTDITAASLNLNTHPVTPLTAASTKAVTALTDSRSVSLNNTWFADVVTSLTTSATSASVSTLDNTTVFNISSMTNGAVNTTATSITVPNGSNKPATVQAPVTLTAGQTFVISGSSNASFNGTWTVSSVVTAGSKYTFGSFTGSISNPTTPGTVTTSNTTVIATTATNHNFAVGGTVTIANVTPSNFNGTKTITAVSSNTFTWANEAVAVAPTAVSGQTMTATGRGTTVLVTTSAAHPFVAGQSVTISGASPAGYNGTFTIVTVPSSTTFTYATATAVTSAATGTITASGSGTTATAVLQTPTVNTYTNGASVTISGASPAGYDGTFTISSVTATSFQYTVPPGLGTATSGSFGIRVQPAANATSRFVVVALNNHGFSNGQAITISGANPSSFNGNWQVYPAGGVLDANTFFFDMGSAFPVPSGGNPTVQLTTNPLAYATIPSHGYSGSPTVTIAGATPSGYNGAFTATIVDSNTISYVLPAAQGPATGTSITASTPTTTALATSTAHGFTNGQTLTISGATPAAFNGTFTITYVDADHFSYTLSSPQLAASGTILAISSGAGASQVNLITDWIRGTDNYQDENANSSFSDTRASIHGDVLHSRPAVVNYNRIGATDPNNADNDVYIFYGGNDGVFRAVKGGFGSTTGDPAPGAEVWGFVAPEFFPSLQRLRLDSPSISSSFKRNYFFDGPIGTFALDGFSRDSGNAIVSVPDGKLVAADGDLVWIFMGMRRGGRFMYALDVSNPLVPKLLWRKGCPSFDPTLNGACDIGWEELGQTWSQPVIIPKINATTDPVLMFGAGYDATVEDIDPATITSVSSAFNSGGSNGSVTSSAGTTNRSMGRGIYVVNARTGDIIWQALGLARSAYSPSLPSVTFPVKVVSGMNYSISADIAVVVGDPTPTPFRAYVGDTGGNVWRIDFGDANPANWTVAKLASIDNTSSNTGLRKFQQAPDVIGAAGFDAVIIGSGDREHPFDTTVTNRVYMFKDTQQTTTPPFTGGVQNQATITEGTGSGTPLLDVTSNCIQIAANCTGTAPQAAGGGLTASQNTAAALNASTNMGWFLTLASGEKEIGAVLASGGGAVQFATNQPSSSAGGGACSPNLGVARQYQVSFADGTAFTGTSVSTTYAGGGFLPSPVLVYVGLGGASGTGSTPGGGVPVGGTVSGNQLKVGAGSSMGGGNDPTGVVCFGASCSLAPGQQLYARLRKFWYKEFD